MDDEANWLRSLQGNWEWHNIPNIFDDEDASQIRICTFAETDDDSLLPMVLIVKNEVETVLRCPHISQEGTCKFLFDDQICPNNTAQRSVQSTNGPFEERIIKNAFKLKDDSGRHLEVRRIPKGGIQEPFSSFSFCTHKFSWMHEDGFEFETRRLEPGESLSPEFLQSKGIRWIGIPQGLKSDKFRFIDKPSERYKTVALQEGDSVFFGSSSEQGIDIAKEGASYAVVCLISKKEQLDS